MEKLIKYKELCKYIPFSRHTVWKKVKNGTFPKPLNVGGTTARSSGKAWAESDILAWVEKQKNEKSK
jgi:predicted DNA-binding transcriptional regulator AlpA